jgi:hypothetical protein
MEWPLPNPAAVRDAIRALCDAAVDPSRFELSYLQAGREGPRRLLYQAPRRDGEQSLIMARRVKPADGPRLEQQLNLSYLDPSPANGAIRVAFYSPELRLLFQAFPADPRLPGLPVAVNGSHMLPILESMLAGRAAGGQLRAVHAKAMRYKPERKCLLRYDLCWDSSPAGKAPEVVWGRLTRPAKFAQTRNVLASLYAASTAAGFEFPEPLGVIEGLNLELFGNVPGTVLFHMVESSRFPVLCHRSGEALAHFHGLPIVVPEYVGVDAQISRLEESSEAFGSMLPGQQSRIADLKKEITRRLPETSPSQPGLIHGDFHGDNILLAGERLALVDMEDCAMGEPADDVGSQWTQLIWHRHRAGAGNMLPAAGCKAFLEGYLENAGGAVEKRLPLYAAMHCFLYAHQCLRHPQDPMRFEDAQTMLGVCEAVLNQDSVWLRL